MDVREKLAELIHKAKAMYADDYTDHTEEEYIAETLLDNFVTVWDGKPLEAFLHPIDAYKGLKTKYLVFKADTGEKVDNCFILRPDKDPVAVEALRAYARATYNEILAEDIYNWVGNGVTVQEWVKVEDRLPENEQDVLITARRKHYREPEKYIQLVAKAFYTDGKHDTEHSAYVWDTCYIDMEYDEENDAYKIPEGWWESVEYGEEFQAVDDFVTHWMPLPQPPKGD